MRKAILIATAGLALAIPASASAVVQELGIAPTRYPATCPTNCNAVAMVTGFQVRQGNVRNPFRVNRAGRIVAFSMKLGEPSRAQSGFFAATFGGRSQARVSILRPPRGGSRHRLMAQSEIFFLSPYFGTTPTFALAKSLPVEKGNIVALTVPTWAPAFAVGLPAEEAWKASRDPETCDEEKQEAAQQSVSGLRAYRCFYRTARLLYSATFVPDPRRPKR